MSYFGTHAHTHYSNIRLIDAINRPKGLIDRAIENGMTGITITDHEVLSAHMEVNQYATKLQKSNPDFKIALGNEIYLTDTRENGQRYYHFILIAKDAIGHKALRELSSTAWINSYFDRGMERVPTLKSELSEIINKYKGHVIAATACLGGELSVNIAALNDAEEVGDMATAQIYHNNIINFMLYCKDLFGDDFYIECAPANNPLQIAVNKRLRDVSQAFGVKMIFGTDAHYGSKEERWVHKAYLNSKNGEREVDDFYEFSYLMKPEEVREYLRLCFDDNFIDELFENTNEIQEKVEYYSLERTQVIPTVKVKNYPRFKETVFRDDMYPTINSLLDSENDQERYWINRCLIELQEKRLWKVPLQSMCEEHEYIRRLETEADVIKFIGERLGTCLFAYFNTFEHYINLFWECGSIVGPGRGSATGFLSNYLLGITQLDPIQWELPYWRFLNKDRVELPDIDIDLSPTRRPAIFSAIREERGELGLVQVSTFGTEGTKSAVLTACRGYRSEEFPEGIDVDVAQYMSSLIPSHRGFLWSLKDVVNGNPDEGRAPVKPFINEVNQYPGLLDIMLSIEGLINQRSTHASGVILYGDDPYETSAIMKTPSGDLVTQFSLHDAEAAGDTKYDFLVTEISDKIIASINLLIKDGLIEYAPLRDLYNKYLHPQVLDTEDQRIWDALSDGSVLDVFQFSTGVGLSVAKKIKPQNPIEMTAANALMRLMAEKGEEMPQDRFARIKTDGLWMFDEEMKTAGLTLEQRSAMHKHCDEYYGCVPLQEQMMLILMDEQVAGFSLAQANDARKIVAKKQMSRIPELKELMYNQMSDKNYADYVWKIAIHPSLG